MSASVISFFRPARQPRDWSAQELAEFYRVEAALIRAGLQVEVDRGLTDEGDPWFVFCRAHDGETVIHFARIDGMYIVAAPVYGGVASGRDFNALVRDLIERHPTITPRSEGRSNLIFHPAALLVILVATAIFKTSEARAFTPGQDTPSDSGRHTTYSSGNFVILSDTNVVVSIDAQHAQMILSAVVIALASDPPSQAGVLVHTSSVDGAGTDNHLLSLSSDLLNPATAIPDATGSSTNQLEGNGALSLVAILWNLPAAPAQNHLLADVVHDPSTLEGGPHSSGLNTLAPISDSPVVNLPAIANATLVIELAGSGQSLPDVIAAHVLLESGVAMALGQGEILQLATLPDTIASILHTSLHIAGDSTGISVGDLINQAVHLNNSSALSGAFYVESQNQPADLSAVPLDHVDANASAASQQDSNTAAPAGNPGPATADLSTGDQHQTNTSVTSVTPDASVGAPSLPAVPPPTPTTSSVDHQDSPPTPEALFHAIGSILASSPGVASINSPTDTGSLMDVDAAVGAFVHEVGLNHLAVVPSFDGSATLIDLDAVTDQNLAHVVSVTFDFKDGTSISLIGLPGEILHAIGWTG